MAVPREELGKPPCFCVEETESSNLETESEYVCESVCSCPKDKHGLVIHQEECYLFKNETFVFPEEICKCGVREDIKKTGRDICVCTLQEGVEKVETIPCECDLPEDVRVERHVCKCQPPEGAIEAMAEWTKAADVGGMPAVLDATHPLMQRFQQTLREFLLKENAVAEEEIQSLKEDLRLSKLAYDQDLETIYIHDHSCNDQRTLIEEYEATMVERTAARQAAEQRAKKALERQKQARRQLDRDLIAEQELREEMEALTILCRQLEQWREETDSDLTVSKLMSKKMRSEKRLLADEKRELDIVVFGLSNEVWKLESKLEMLKKQTQIKAAEMDKINEKVTAYGCELEDLNLDKRRLVTLWNAVLNNIAQRDRIYNTVREDYLELQQHFQTLICSLEVTKKGIKVEIEKSKEIAMTKDKLVYETNKIVHKLKIEDEKRITLETNLEETNESIEMCEKDQELMKAENAAIGNRLKTTDKDLYHKINKKRELDSEILDNLQECLLNNKAVQSMANGIKNLRKLSKKQEISLMVMETQHARLVLNLERGQAERVRNESTLKETLAQVKAYELKLHELEEKYNKREFIARGKQRELEVVINKYLTLKVLYNAKNPLEIRIGELEQQIKAMRENMFKLQHDWLRLQGHVVKLTEHHQSVTADIHLIKKQLQICEEKCMHNKTESDKVIHESACVDQRLRDMRSQLQVLERKRIDAQKRNSLAQLSNVSITQEYAVSLKAAEIQIFELEEEIEVLDKEKVNLTQEIDRVQREALIWQRKGILAVELKKSMKEAKSAAGEIGKMRNEIHKMETRREHLRRNGEKLAEDLAHYVTRRGIVMEKTRAHAAVEKKHASHGYSQSTYHHKMRLAKDNVASAKKQLHDAEASLTQLQEDQKRLECGIARHVAQTSKLEEQIACLLQRTRETDRMSIWLLERVVRCQRFGSELATVVRRQSLHIKKPKATILQEYSQVCDLNERLKYIVEQLTKEYPQFGDKFAVVDNTLNIHSPSDSPRLVADSPSVCGPIPEEDGSIPDQLPCPNGIY